MTWPFNRVWCWGLSLLTLVVLLALKPTTASSPSPTNPEALPSAIPIEVVGRTRCTPRRKALLAPVPLHPVVEVLVSPGDRVKKEQPLIKLDDEEQQAEVRAKKAALERAEIALKEARRYCAEVEKYRESLPMQKYYDASVAAAKAEADERAAKAALQGAEAELEHYTVVAPIDGVVNRLDVSVGMISRPGTAVWGEIVDLGEIDVDCELPSNQVDQVAVGQSAEVRSLEKKESFAVGKVVFVGFAADKATGLVPVTVRLAHAEWRLRSGVPVQVRFTEARSDF